MKKTFKKIFALIICMALCLSLCSCKMLDEMKEEQAFYLNEDQTEILWNDVVYKCIPIDDNILGDFQFVGYITETDVPVLMSSMFGYGFSVVEPYGIIHGVKDLYYCKADEYDYYMTLLANYNKDKYAYRTEEITAEHSYRSYLNIVDAETVKAIEEILAFHKVENFNLQTNWMYSIYTCEDTGTFYDNCFEVVEVRGDGYYFQYEDKINGEEHYKVPVEYKPLFDKIYFETQQADKYW